MKVALLLSGLQRNFQPFINNHIEKIIKRYNCDLFVFNLNKNNNRYISEGKISYKINDNFDNDISYFQEKYKEFLKDIYIDNDNKLFEEFKKKNINIKEENNNFTLNLISQYFKIHSCLNLMEKYEKKNNFKYDIIFRMRLDGFTAKNYLEYNLNNFNFENNCYMSKAISGWKDDSCLIISRKYSFLLEKFVFELIKYVNGERICVEEELFKFISKNSLNIIFINNLICRVGTIERGYCNIPFLKLKDFENLKSLEYKIYWEE